MELKRLSASQSLLITNHGDEVLYSQEEPVAGFKLGLGFFKNRNWGEPLDYLKDIDDVTLLTTEQIAALFN